MKDFDAKTMRELRAYLGHNGCECRVRIGNGGWVRRHGSPDTTDRSMDYWHDIGWAWDLVDEMRRQGTIYI